MAATLGLFDETGFGVTTYRLDVTIGAVGSLGIAKITAPNGAVCYKNSGYDTDNFASPDYVSGTTDYMVKPLTGGVLPNYKPIPGNYVVDIKVKLGGVLQPAQQYVATFVTPTFYLTYAITTNNTTPPSTLTFTDNTNYSGVTLVSRTMTFNYPPPLGLSGVSGTGPSLSLPYIYPSTIFQGYQGYLVNYVTFDVAGSGGSNINYQIATSYSEGTQWFAADYPPGTTFHIDMDATIPEIDIHCIVGYGGTKGLLKIVAPNEVEVYKNPGYDANNFASPDFLAGTTEDVTKTFMGALENNKPIPGTYTFTIKRKLGTVVMSTYSYTVLYDPISITETFTVVENGGVDPVNMLLTDTTSYGNPLTTSVTRAWDVAFPTGVNLPDVTGTTESIIVSPLYGGLPYTITLSGTINRSVAATGDNSPYTITQTFTTTQPYSVVMAKNQCEAVCITNAVFNKMKGAQGSEQQEYWTEQYATIAGTPALIQSAYACGQNEYAAGLLAWMKQVSNITADGCDCGCSDEPTTPYLITNGCGCDGGAGDVPGAWIIPTEFDADVSRDMTLVNEDSANNDYVGVRYRVEREYSRSGATHQIIHVVGGMTFLPDDGGVLPLLRGLFVPTTMQSRYLPDNTAPSSGQIYTLAGLDWPCDIHLNTDGKMELQVADNTGADPVTEFGFAVFVDFQYEILKK